MHNLNGNRITSIGKEFVWSAVEHFHGEMCHYVEGFCWRPLTQKKKKKKKKERKKKIHICLTIYACDIKIIITKMVTFFRFKWADQNKFVTVHDLNM